MQLRLILSAFVFLVTASTTAAADAYLDLKSDLEFEKAASGVIGTGAIGAMAIGANNADLIRRLEKKLPPLEAAKMRSIDKKLEGVSDEQLLLFEVLPDICKSTLFDCGGLPTGLVKPMISIALEQRKSAENKSAARETRIIAWSSILISLVSLGATFLGRKSA